MSLQKNKNAKWWLISVCLVCVLGGLIVFVTGVGPWDVPQMAKRLPELRKESLRLGLPLSYEDAKLNQDLPDDENLLNLLEPLADDFGEFEPEIYLLLEDPVALYRAETTVDFLNEHQNQIDTAAEYVRTTPDWSDNGTFSEWMTDQRPRPLKLVKVAELLSARSALRAQIGEIDQALDDFLAARLVLKAAAADRQSRTIDQVLYWEYYMADLAVLLAERIGDSPTQLGELIKVWGATDFGVDPRETFKLDFFFDYSIQTLGSGKRPNEEHVPLVSGGQASACEIWNEIYRRLDKLGDPPRIFSDDFKDLGTKFGDELMRESVSQAFAGYGGGGVDITLKRINEHDARRAVVRSMLKILMFKAREGRLPVSLDEADASELDPYTGVPVCSKIESGEAWIWSAGNRHLPHGVTESAKPTKVYSIYPRKAQDKFKEEN